MTSAEIQARIPNLPGVSLVSFAGRYYNSSERPWSVELTYRNGDTKVETKVYGSCFDEALCGAWEKLERHVLPAEGPLALTPPIEQPIASLSVDADIPF